MKKRMKSAAMLVTAAVLCGGIPAETASALYCWGTAGNNEFHDMTLLDDKGMFAGIPRGEGIGTADNYQVLTYHYSYDREYTVTDADTGKTKTELYHFEGDPVYVVCPRENCLRFVLKTDLDEAEAETKMLAVLDQYYPGISTLYLNAKNGSNYDAAERGTGTAFGVSVFEEYDNCIEIIDRSETAGSAEISDGIMHGLADAGLISEFYTWGQTARYQEVQLSSGDAIPTAYFPIGHRRNSDETEIETVCYDWEAIKAWVEAHYPECEFVRVTLDDTELAKKIGRFDPEMNKPEFHNYDEMYAVIPPDGTPFPEHFAIAAELYAQFGIAPEWGCPESANEPLIGENALAKAIPGDVDENGKITVGDAVLIARFAANDSTVEISAKGKINADVTGDGQILSDDLTKVLRFLANLIPRSELSTKA